MQGNNIYFKKYQIWLKCAQYNWPDYRVLVGRGSGNWSDRTPVGKRATRKYRSSCDSRISFWDYKYKRQTMRSSCYLLRSCITAADNKDTCVITSSPAITAPYPASYSWLVFPHPVPVRPVWIILVLLPGLVASYSAKAYQIKLYSENCIMWKVIIKM